MGKFNQSKYCYPNSTILINKFDVHDQQKLDQLEAYYVGRRLYQLRENPLRGKLYIEEQGKELFKELKKIRNFSHELYNLQECTDSSSFIEVENY
ncbi:hypothetical protein [Lysinibacillus sp. fls2-241-R2A-57]|uniref:hypothetical protein n=1 Tax=Lysinibacillus sp. fls2-241-R2A-57 TaxID=3040292 RepID=UPI002553191B|nr:hypothetical protein [Lysinibacillus sp. fls2-241-R2A-57]